MEPVKVFKIVWNVWAVVGMLVTFAILGVQLGQLSSWALEQLQGLLGMLPV